MTAATAFVVVLLLSIEAAVFLTAIRSGHVRTFLILFGVGVGVAACVLRRIARLSLSARIFLAITVGTVFGALFLVGLGY